MFKQFLIKWKIPILSTCALVGPTYYFVDSYYLPSGKARHLEKEIEDTIAKYGEKGPRLAGLYEKLGNIYYSSEDAEKASGYYRNANELFELVDFHSFPGSIEEFYRKFAETLQKTGDKKSSVYFLEKSLDQQQLNNGVKPHLVEEYKNIALINDEIGEVERAVLCLRKAIEAESQLDQPNDAIAVEVFKSLGDVFYKQSEKQFSKPYLLEANALYEKALARANLAYGANSLVSAKVLYDIAKVNQALYQFDKSFYYCAKSIELLSSNHAKSNKEFAHCSGILGTEFMHKGKDEEALTFLEYATSTYESIPRSEIDEINFAKILANLAVLLVRLNKTGEAENSMKQATEKFKAFKGPESIEALNASFNLALILQKNQNHAEAIKVASEIYNFAKTKFGPTHQLTQSSLELLKQISIQ